MHSYSLGVLLKLPLSDEKNAHDEVGSVGVLEWRVEVRWELK
jgi:hypothetical protein